MVAKWYISTSLAVVIAQLLTHPKAVFTTFHHIFLCIQSYHRYSYILICNRLSLFNCFGIEKLSHTFDFSNRKPYSIYARNGMMKTSFANTFQFLHEGKEAEICDKIFGYPGYAKVEIDGRTIGKEQIFVVKSYESYYESNISPLLIKGQIQEQLQETLAARKQFLKILEKASGLKIQRTVQGKKKYELEPQIIEDFAFTENSILLNLDELDA